MDSTREDPGELPHGFWTTHDPKVRPGLPGDDDLVYFSWYAEGVPIADIDEAIAAIDPAAGVTAGEEDALVAQFVPEPAADPFGFLLVLTLDTPHASTGELAAATLVAWGG